MAKHVGILTAGGDSPGLNAAIRGVGKAGIGAYGMDVIGFRDGFRGLMQNRIMRLDSAALSGILTRGERSWEPAETSLTRCRWEIDCST